MILTVDNISKSYPSAQTNSELFKDLWSIIFKNKNQSDVQVLKNISFKVKQGESLAIVGKNGAGKSTLLKIITGVTNASGGVVSVQGSVGALLELGAGFDYEQTGLENVKMSLRLSGMKTQQIEANIARIKAFADIGQYFTHPVKNYSSGMVVRLGFAIITVVKPDLLITDEVLAVGDESFQLKCLKWIDEYLKEGGTLLLVSHSVYHVQKLCQKAIWLDGGEIKKSGDVFEVTQAYQESIADKNKMPSGAAVNKQGYHIHNAEILSNDQVIEEVNMGADINLKVKVYSPDDNWPNICIGVVTQQGAPVYGTYSELYDTHPYLDSDGFVVYEVKLPELTLLPGRYEFRFHCMTPENMQMIDTFEKYLRVVGQTREMGATRLPTIWK